MAYQIDFMNGKTKLSGWNLADRWIYDTMPIATGATLTQFFQTTAAKFYHQANFEGDYTLVPDGHVFQVLAKLIRVVKDNVAATQTFTIADANELFSQSYYEWEIQGVITDRTACHYVAGGFDHAEVYEPANLGAANTVVSGDGRHDNMRTFRVEKVVPGGRNIKYNIQTPGGIVLGQTRAVQVSFYGNEITLV